MRKCECCGQSINKGGRTNAQNAAIHLYFDWLAKAFRESGIDVRAILSKRPKMDVPVTQYFVKEHLYKPILLTMEGKESTTEMDTVQPGDVYETLNRWTAQTFGISVAFPSKETMYLEAIGRKK